VSNVRRFNMRSEMLVQREEAQNLKQVTGRQIFSHEKNRDKSIHLEKDHSSFMNSPDMAKKKRKTAKVKNETSERSA